MNDTSRTDSSYRIFRSLLGLLTLCLLVMTAGCKKAPEHSVAITEYLSLTDSNGIELHYGLEQSAVDEMIETVRHEQFWEGAHENMEILFTSSLFYEDPTIVQLRVTATVAPPYPTWTTPQGIQIGDERSSVLTTLGKSKEELEGQVLDLLFAQDPTDSSRMYEISMEELYDLPADTTIFRAVYRFQGDILEEIIVGDLASMA